jgi:hypothetical protein
VTNPRVEAATLLGAPFMLCIQCLHDFLEPNGFRVEWTANNKTDALVRTCCSLSCALLYGDARGRAATVLVYDISSDELVAIKDSGCVRWKDFQERVLKR